MLLFILRQVSILNILLQHISTPKYIFKILQLFAPTNTFKTWFICIDFPSGDSWKEFYIHEPSPSSSILHSSIHKRILLLLFRGVLLLLFPSILLRFIAVLVFVFVGGRSIIDRQPKCLTPNKSISFRLALCFYIRACVGLNIQQWNCLVSNSSRKSSILLRSENCCLLSFLLEASMKVNRIFKIESVLYHLTEVLFKQFNICIKFCWNWKKIKVFSSYTWSSTALK